MSHLPKADRPPMPSHCWHRADPGRRTPLPLHMGHVHSMCTLDESQPPNTPQLPLPYIFFWILRGGSISTTRHTTQHDTHRYARTWHLGQLIFSVMVSWSGRRRECHVVPVCDGAWVSCRVEWGEGATCARCCERKEGPAEAADTVVSSSESGMRHRLSRQ